MGHPRSEFKGPRLEEEESISGEGEVRVKVEGGREGPTAEDVRVRKSYEQEGKKEK